MTKRTLIMMILVIGLLGLFTNRARALEATGAGGLRLANQMTRLEQIKTRAEQEINRRITLLNTLISKIADIKRLSGGQKTDFTSQINGLVSQLQILNTKIQSDADLATLVADGKSILNTYRVYMLFMPKINIMAAADRISEIASQALVLVPAVQNRISQVQSAGHDVTALNNALADFQSKLNDAQTQATNATDTVSVLVPDMGNVSTMQANTAVIKSARGMIITAIHDMNAARSDIRIIRQGIGNLNPKPTKVPATTPY